MSCVNEALKPTGFSRGRITFNLRTIDRKGIEEVRDFHTGQAVWEKMAESGCFSSSEIDRLIGTAVRKGGVTQSIGNAFFAIRFEE